MAQLSDVTDRGRIDKAFERKNPRPFVSKGRPPRPSHPGEKSRRVYHQFGIEAEEFNSMTVEDLWQYVDEMLDRTTDSIKDQKLAKGRPVQCRSFSSPANTTNRRVETINEDGLFIQVVARRVGIPRQGREPQQDVWVEISAELSDD